MINGSRAFVRNWRNISPSNHRTPFGGLSIFRIDVLGALYFVFAMHVG